MTPSHFNQMKIMRLVSWRYSVSLLVLRICSFSTHSESLRLAQIQWVMSRSHSQIQSRDLRAQLRESSGRWHRHTETAKSTYVVSATCTMDHVRGCSLHQPILAPRHKTSNRKLACKFCIALGGLLLHQGASTTMVWECQDRHLARFTKSTATPAPA